MKSLWRHKKTGNIYEVSYMEVINCTNAQDGQIMVLYKRGGKTFVREINEFKEKFEPVTIRRLF